MNKKILFIQSVSLMLAFVIVLSLPMLAEALETKDKIKIYFSAKLSKPEYQKENYKLGNTIFSQKQDVFFPQEFVIPKLGLNSVEKYAYYVDKEAIDWADILFLRSPYGKDCSWEVGYAKGKDKFLVGYFQDKESVNDTMIVGSLDVIFTDKQEVMNILKADIRTKNKSFFVKNLGNCFDDVVNNFYTKR